MRIPINIIATLILSLCWNAGFVLSVNLTLDLINIYVGTNHEM